MTHTADGDVQAPQVLLFYKYITVEDPHELARTTRSIAERCSLAGRVIVAPEGVNATLEGAVSDTEAFLVEFKCDARFADIQVKRSGGTGRSFPGLSVRVRNELVSTGLTHEEADPRVKSAPKLSPEELREWYESRRDFVVVDMRNSYEIASGKFEHTIDPGISASRHLPLVVHTLEPLKHKTVVTVCTGGVRCEKMSAYLQHKGFSDVFQLDGGIHSYMQKYPGKDFKGTLYTFDQRITMDFGGDREVIGTCYICSSATETYVNCANTWCHLHFLACSACTDEFGSSYCSADCRVAARASSELNRSDGTKV